MRDNERKINLIEEGGYKKHEMLSAKIFQKQG